MNATTRQIGAIHALAAKAGMDEDTRRAFLNREAGVVSCRQLTLDEAARVIDKLMPLAGAAKGAVAGMTSPIARKLRALWIAGYDLGLVRDRTDRALLSFVERQTGVSHVRFLREPGQGAAAVEGLKDWLARAGTVDWPTAAHAPVEEKKRAVIDAQWRRLLAFVALQPRARETCDTLDAYAFKITGRPGWEHFQPAHYDQVQNALGRKLRARAQQQEVVA